MTDSTDLAFPVPTFTAPVTATAPHSEAQDPHSAEDILLKAGALQNAIFNSANFSSIATDARGVIQIFNVGAERMLGYTAAEVLNQITPADISDPVELIERAGALSLELATPISPGFEALVFKASRGIEDIYELTYIRKDGSRLSAMVSVTALRDAQNSIIGYLLIGTDNTARKLVEAELKQAKAVAESASQTKSDFLASMSHEIRTPMNSIMGIADLLAKTELSPEQDKYVQIFQRSGENLLNLINDILDLSKVEASQLELEKTGFSLHDHLEKVTEMVGPRAAEKGLTLARPSPKAADGRMAPALENPSPVKASMITRFLFRCRANVATMQAALDRADFAPVTALEHQLCGAGSMFGFDRLTEIGAGLEQAGSNTDDASSRMWLTTMTACLDEIEVNQEI